MTFTLSKIFWLAAQPLSAAFLAIFLSLFCGWLGWRRMRSFLALMAALILFLTLYTTSGAWLLQKLEDRIARPETLPSNLSCILILGGGFETEVTTSRGGFELNQGGDRFVEGLRLARLHPGARILVSGGDGSLGGTYEGDARTAVRFFEAFGISANRLVQEATSRNTHENAVNTRVVLEKEGLGDCVLITSAFHMPRSIGLFRKNGMSVIPWPVDYHTPANVRIGFDFTQPSLNTQLMTTAVREWIGLLAYYLAGRTHALVPE